jgi:signal transduction histidine kinase
MHKNAQLKQAHDQLEQKIAVFKLLFDLEKGMARASNEQELVEAVLVQTIRATETGVGALLLRSEQRSDFVLYVLREAGNKGPVRSFVKHVGGLVGRCMSEASPLLAERLDDEDDVTSSDTTVVGCDVESGIAVPLEGEEGAIMGALAFYDRVDGNTFSNDDLELLRLVGANASTAISLRKERESREATERLSTIGRLLSSVLHDLKTPMTVISGYVQLLSITKDAHQREEYSELVMKQFEHITAMQKEVLAFARGERSLLLSRIYLYKFFEEFEANVRRELEGRAIAFVLNLEDRGIARFDEGKMTRALHNLVRNAQDAIGDTAGTITVDVKRDKDDLVISVSDTGPGIPKEIEGKLFQSFVTAGKKGGTGLGLAIVKKVVEEHGGQVSVMSSKKGAVFTIRLPQTASAPAHAASSPAPKSNRSS